MNENEEKDIIHNLSIKYAEYKLKNLTKEEEEKYKDMRADHCMFEYSKEFKSVYNFMKNHTV